MTDDTLATGHSVARSPRTTPHEYLLKDLNPPPDVLLEESALYLGSDPLPVHRYLSAEFAQREMAQMWGKVWQMACHEEELLDVGDTVVYDIGRWSFVLVRSSDNSIKAYYNSCLHRGTQLRCEDGPTRELRCPFHGWAWNLDGELTDLPERWDFPHVRTEGSHLPEIRVDVWDGWVFVTIDPDTEPLLEYLEEVPRHFSRINPHGRRVGQHIVKRVDCNWKTALEAFIESYHVMQTHPQTVIATAGPDSEYDIYLGKRHFSRMITSIGVPGTGLGTYEISDQDVIDNLYSSGRVGDVDIPILGPDESARPLAADIVRQQRAQQFGVDLADVSDSELLDGIEYYIFPNFMPWVGYQVPLTYRFRPDGLNPDSAIFEVYIMEPVEDGAVREHAPKAYVMREDEEFKDIEPLIGRYSVILQQDYENFGRIRRGMQASKKQTIDLANYQESRIRHYHQTLDQYLSD